MLYIIVVEEAASVELLGLGVTVVVDASVVDSGAPETMNQVSLHSSNNVTSSSRSHLSHFVKGYPHAPSA